MNWNWQKLIVAVLAAIAGWLSGILVPAPGTQKVPAPGGAVERLK